MVVQRVSVRAFELEGWQSDVRRAMFLLTTLGVFLVAIKIATMFRTLIGAWIVALGVLMNLLPMTAHFGLMPIASETLQESGIHEVTADDIGKPLTLSKDIVLLREDIRFELLSDRYILTLPIIGPNVYSMGDFVLFAGLCLALVEAAVRTVRGERSAHRQLTTE